MRDERGSEHLSEAELIEMADEARLKPPRAPSRPPAANMESLSKRGTGRFPASTKRLLDVFMP